MQQVLFALIGSLPFLVAQCPQPTPPGASFADATRISDWDEASSERTYPIDAEFDCGVRKLALEYASKVLQDVPDAKQALAQVHDALQLKTCSASIGDVHAWKYLLSSSFEASRYDATTTEYYVSPQGSDTNSGTEGSPFRTIVRARDEIRKTSGEKESLESEKDFLMRMSRRAVNERKSISVILREGTYYLNGTLFLEPQDSGVSDEMPITYRAYQARAGRTVHFLSTSFPFRANPSSCLGELNSIWTGRSRETMFIEQLFPMTSKFLHCFETEIASNWRDFPTATRRFHNRRVISMQAAVEVAAAKRERWCLSIRR